MTCRLRSMEPRRISNLKASQRVSVELSSPEMRIRSQSVDGDAEVQWHQDQHSACSVWVGYPQAVQKILATQPRLMLEQPLSYDASTMSAGCWKKPRVGKNFAPNRGNPKAGVCRSPEVRWPAYHPASPTKRTLTQQPSCLTVRLATTPKV